MPETIDTKNSPPLVVLTTDTNKNDIEKLLFDNPTMMHYSLVFENNPSLVELKPLINLILRSDNICIVDKRTIIDQWNNGTLIVDCIDGRGIIGRDESKNVILHIPWAWHGLLVVAPMGMLQEMSITDEQIVEIITRFSDKYKQALTCHSCSHSKWDDSITTCGCGHLKNHGLKLNELLLTLANTQYNEPKQLPGDHKEKIVHLSVWTNQFATINVPNDLEPWQNDSTDNQVFWFDVWASEVVIDECKATLTQIINEVCDTSYDMNEIWQQWMKSLVAQAFDTVEFLDGARSLKNEWKILTTAVDENDEIIIDQYR